MKRSNKKGFTTVELVIVIAVIAILAAVLIPTFANLVEKANLSADEQAARHMNTILTAESASGNAPSTLYEVDKIFKANNIVPDGYAPLATDHAFYWDSTKNLVVLWSNEESKVVYPDGFEAVTSVPNTWQWFAMDKTANLGDKLSSEGGNITVDAPMTSSCVNFVPGGILVSEKEATIDFAGQDYTYSVTYETGMNGTALSAIAVLNGADLTLKNGNVQSEGYGVYAKDGTLTIESGTYIGKDGTAVQVANATVYITGGHFEADNGDAVYLINCLDNYYSNGTAKVVITGGTFVNFNPAASNAEPGGPVNWVADGYKVVEKPQANGDIWYTVEAE